MIDEYEVKRYFSKRIAEELRNREIRTWYVGYYCEMAETSVKECLAGTRLPNPWQLILMAELFECSVNDLLGFEHYENGIHQLVISIPMGQSRTLKAFSKRLFEMIKDRGLSIDEFAERCDVSTGMFKNWFRNTSRFPRIDRIFRFCEVLSCTPSELLGY